MNSLARSENLESAMAVITEYRDEREQFAKSIHGPDNPDRQENAVYELQDIEVERVDAVDRPATGRKWLILKSEEEDEQMVNIDEFESIVRTALTQIKMEHDRGALTLSEQSAAALNALAALVGEGGELFHAQAAAEPVQEAAQESATEQQAELAESVPAATQESEEAERKEAAEEGQDSYGYGYPDPQMLAMILDELKAIRQLLAEMVQKQSVQKSAPPPSKQPDPAERVSRIPRWGEGLFADVIFGPRR